MFSFRWLQNAQFLAVVVMFTVSLMLPANAQDSLPAIRMQSTDLESPITAWTYYLANDDDCPADGTGCAVSTAPRDVRLQRLADALNDDPELIYEYVKYNIDYAPMFGILKGAYGAVMDGAGTSFDQVQLMVELLREAGFTARYKVGTVDFDMTVIEPWFGTDDPTVLSAILADGGIPATVSGSTVSMLHIWVEVQIDGQWKEYDPSVKEYIWHDGESLDAKTGIQGSLNTVKTFISGYSSSSGYIQNIPSATLKANADAAAMAISTELSDTANAGKGIPELVGGREPAPEIAYAGQLDTLTHTNATVNATWTGDIPLVFHAKLKLRLHGWSAEPYFELDANGDPTETLNANYVTCGPGTSQTGCDGFSHTWSTQDIAARRLATTFFDHVEAFTPPDDIVLRLDEDIVFDGIEFPSGAESARITAIIEIDHPYAGYGEDTLAADGSIVSAEQGSYMDEVVAEYLPGDTWSVIATGFGPVTGKSTAEWQRAGLNNGLIKFPYYFDAFTPGGAPLPENLQGLGPGVSAQYRTKAIMARDYVSMINNLGLFQARVWGGQFLHHHSIGVVSSTVRKSIFNNQVKSDTVYTDITTRYSYRDFSTSQVNERKTFGHSFAALSSALEAFAGQKMTDQPDPLSPVTMLSWLNDNTVAGGEYTDTSNGLYLIYPDDQAQRTWVASQIATARGLTGTSAETDNVERTMGYQAYLENGYAVVVGSQRFLGPTERAYQYRDAFSGGFYQQNGSTFVDAKPHEKYFGHGIVAFKPGEAESVSYLMLTPFRSGKGGGAAPVTLPDADFEVNDEFLEDQYAQWAEAFDVNLQTGDLELTLPEDIRIGQGEFPYALSSSRSFDSARRDFNDPTRLAIGGLFPETGWRTNNDIEINIASDMNNALGASSPLGASQTLAAMYALKAQFESLEGTESDIDQLMGSILIANWWLEQLNDNTVSIHSTSQNQTFLRQADGSFVPAVGSTGTLLQSGGKERVRQVSYIAENAGCTGDECVSSGLPSADSRPGAGVGGGSSGGGRLVWLSQPTYIGVSSGGSSTGAGGAGCYDLNNCQGSAFGQFDNTIGAGIGYSVPMSMPATVDLSLNFPGFEPSSSSFTDVRNNIDSMNVDVSWSYENVGFSYTDDIGNIMSFSFHYGGDFGTFADAVAELGGCTTPDYIPNIPEIDDSSCDRHSYGKAAGEWKIDQWTFINAPDVTYEYNDPQQSLTGFSLGNIISLKKVFNSLGHELDYQAGGNVESEKWDIGIEDNFFSSITLDHDYIPTSTHIQQMKTPKGQITSLTLPSEMAKAESVREAVITIEYDALARVSKLTDRDNQFTTYDIAENAATVTNPVGSQSHTRYDALDRLAQSRDAMGNISVTHYDTLSRRAGERFHDASDTANYQTRTGYGYDARHNLIYQAQFPKEAAGVQSISCTRTEYHTQYNRISRETVTFLNSNPACPEPANIPATSYSFGNGTGDTGKVIGMTGPEGTEATYTYNDLGQMIEEKVKTDASSWLTTAYAYDPGTGYITSATTDPGGENIVTSFPLAAYTTKGDPGEITDPNGNTTAITYDSRRRKTAITLPQVDSFSVAADLTETLAAVTPTTEISYDADGRVTYVRQQRSPGEGTVWATTSYDYWPTGQVKMVTDPAGKITSSYYDAAGRAILTVDPENRKTRTVYDVLDRPEKIIRAWQGDPASPEAPGSTDCTVPGTLQQCYQQYTYTAVGEINTVTDAGGNLTQYTYDRFQRLKEIFFPDSTGQVPGVFSPTDYEQYDYDARGNLVTKRTRSGDVSTYIHDDLGRVIARHVPGAPDHDPYLHTGLDLSAHGLTKVTHETSWDLASRKFKERHNNLLHTYEYDNAGRLQRTDVGNNHMPFTYGYDAAGNLTSLTYPDGFEVAYEYDALNRVSRVRDVTGIGNARVLADIFHDAQSRRSRMVYGNGTASTTAAAGDRRTFRYDIRGNLSRLDVLAISAPMGMSVSTRWDFGYNDVSQVTTETLSLDGALWWSPPASSATFYQPNGLNQYQTMSVDGAPAVAMAYDGNGNMTVDWQGRSYTYDAENVLRSVSDAGGTIATYKYHPSGQRKSKTVGTVESQYWYFGDQEILETEDTQVQFNNPDPALNTRVLRRYVRLPGSVDEAFLMLDYSADPANPEEHWVHQNRLGSAVMITDQNGMVQDRFTYDPYGNHGNSATGFPFRFTGQKLDPETGLMYYKARYYAPEIGRFLQTDPIGYADQMNLYAYTYNDPVNNSDPTGRQGYSFYPGQAQAQYKVDKDIAIPTAIGILTAVEFGLIAADVVAFGPSGEGIVPAGVVRSGREFIESLSGKGIKEIGDYGEDRAASEITSEGGEILARQDRLSTKSDADIIYRDSDGSVVCCEVKTGKTADSAPLSSRQAQTKQAVESGDIVTTSDGTRIDRYEQRRYPIDY